MKHCKACNAPLTFTYRLFSGFDDLCKVCRGKKNEKIKEYGLKLDEVGANDYLDEKGLADGRVRSQDGRSSSRPGRSRPHP